MKRNVLKYIATIVSIVLLFSSCGELAKVRKSNDASLKYNYAKKYYNEQKYSKAVDLLSDIITTFEGSKDGARILYMLGDCEYHLKHYQTAAEYFKQYYTSYPKGDKVEDAYFYAGYALFNIMPDPRLDQSLTHEAIKQLQLFIELYPQSKKRNSVKEALFALQDNLAKKELLSAQLYYNLGMYLGNNYKAAIITAENALKDYPYNKYREDFYFVQLEAAYKEAINSVDEKLQTRYRGVIDRYFIYTNEFPNGKYIKEARKMYDHIKSHLSEDL